MSYGYPEKRNKGKDKMKEKKKHPYKKGGGKRSLKSSQSSKKD